MRSCYSESVIGNLIKDTKEGITKINWTVYGKIESIEKSDGTTINYSYDAAGNRINKTVTKAGATNTTVYVRDAQGNVMSVYNADVAINSAHFTQSELHLYGSSRLGIYNVNKDLTVTSAAPVNMGSGNSGILNNFERGKKLFELSNHLGNVLATVSDEKIGVDVAPQDGIIDYYTADVVSANDYYPFGASLPGREFDFGKTLHGFNGQLRDKDIQKDHHTALFWEYDPRIGRRWNVDPVPKSMVSGYAVLGNSPIMFVDPFGNDWYHNKKTHQTEWFDTRKEARKAGYRKHLGVNFWQDTDKKGVSMYFGNSKDQMWQFKELGNVTVTAKSKKPSIMDRSVYGKLFNSLDREDISSFRNNLYSYMHARNGGAVANSSFSQMGVNFERYYQGNKQGRQLAMGFTGVVVLPLAAMAVVETGATYYVYQGGSWVIRRYGMSFAQEVVKEGIANRGNLLKMDWSDIFVSTVLSKWKSVGANGIAEMINATSDLSIDGGFQNSFLRGTKYEKKISNTASDLFFGGLRVRYSGTYSEMAVDQVQTQFNQLVGF